MKRKIASLNIFSKSIKRRLETWSTLFLKTNIVLIILAKPPSKKKFFFPFLQKTLVSFKESRRKKIVVFRTSLEKTSIYHLKSLQNKVG